MGRVSPAAFRSTRASELDALARILERAEICDAYPLKAAAQECRDKGSREGEKWCYTMGPLIFRGLPHPRGARPQDATDLVHSLTVDLVGVCEDDGYLGDPFLHLVVEIQGRAQTGGRPLHSAWHLDRHLVQEGDGPGEAAHPLYHFQYGGNWMISLQDDEMADYGDSLLLGPPRLAHPPMDAIMAVDFVLSNFGLDKRRVLFSDPEYRRLVVEAQKRVWLPYARILANGWEGSVLHGTWDAALLWPQLSEC